MAFHPHGDGELNEYFSTDHSKIIAETSKEVLASLSESRDRLSGKLCYEFHFNQRRYKYTLLRFADMIVRADVTIKMLKKRSDLLQEIVDKGEIYKHLDELDTKVTDAVNRQTELLTQSSRDYQAAVMSGRIDQSSAIGNLLRMQAQRAVYDTMIYLWRDE